MAAQKKILVVDDEPDVLSLITIILKTSGYDVISAIDGQEALEKARTISPDLIILDIMLPKMDGFRVSRMLKFDEKYKNIPIVMLTAKVQNQDRQTGMSMGADFYMTKPFETQELLAKVQEILSQKK